MYMYIYINMYMYIYVYICTYGVAMISMLPKIIGIGLFCKKAL